LKMGLDSKLMKFTFNFFTFICHCGYLYNVSNVVFKIITYLFHVVVDLAKTRSFFIILLIHFYTREQTWMNTLNWVYKEKKLVEEI